MKSTLPSDAAKLFSGLASGPVALILNEDDVELAATVAHHQSIGFPNVVVLGSRENFEGAQSLDWNVRPSIAETINPLLPALVGRWVLVVWNAEFFFFPFCEDRAASDMLMFAASENRSAIHAVTVDLYASDIGQHKNGVDLLDSHFDVTGYFAEDRFDGPDRLARQRNVFGGLKWRYMQHIPWLRQRINRVPLFQVGVDSSLSPDDHLSDPEQNTFESAWHHTLSGAVASFRVAKSLLHNPGSQFDVDSFMWSQSRKFDWQSEQLMTSGFMEPGQWF